VKTLLYIFTKICKVSLKKNDYKAVFEVCILYSFDLFTDTAKLADTTTEEITVDHNIVILLRLNQMLYALCLSYHSNAEAVLFACLLSGWTTTTGRLLGLKVGNSIVFFPRKQRRATAS